MNIVSGDKASERGVRTGLQAICGFVIGLVTVVWGIPGVPNTITKYIFDNYVQILLMVGVPSGLISFVWNVLRKDVTNI